MRYLYLIIAIIVIIFAVFYYGASKNPPSYSVPDDQSYDATTTIPVPRNDQSNPAFDMIEVTYPKDGDAITSPLKVTGKARGNWYFEASFPIDVVDSERKIIGQGIAQAKGEWMTSEYVPFEGTITFTKPTATASSTGSQNGSVIFKKDNPSDMRQNDASIEVPVKFK